MAKGQAFTELTNGFKYYMFKMSKKYKYKLKNKNMAEIEKILSETEINNEISDAKLALSKKESFEKEFARRQKGIACKVSKKLLELIPPEEEGLKKFLQLKPLKGNGEEIDMTILEKVVITNLNIKPLEFSVEKRTVFVNLKSEFIEEYLIQVVKKTNEYLAGYMRIFMPASKDETKKTLGFMFP
jgi:hypothetical protein